MSTFYTSIYRQSNLLYIREVRDGKRRRFKTEYKPTLYLPSKNPNCTLKAPDGTPVEPVQPGKMGECYQFFQKYKGVDNFKIYGNSNYEYAYINENYPGVIEYNINDLVVCNLDIEVDSKHGFADPSTAMNEVTAITIKSSVDDVFHVFACKPFDEIEYNTKHTDSVIMYHQCSDEIDMLTQFIDLWETLEPDIVTGWNIRLYDMPYLINRISRIMAAEDARRLSPWEIIKENTVNIFGKPEVVYDIAGISILDYLLIYRKNVQEPRESYKLDYIAQVELGEGKVNYGEYGTLQELYEKDFKKFIEYNIHDVRLVDRIDAKRKLIELQLIVAYKAKVNYVDVFSQVRTWDTNICNHLLAENIVVPQKNEIDKDIQFVGAYVMKPIPGMYEWVAAFDVQSLYPRMMQTLNIGMETKLELKDLTPEMRRYQNYINNNLMIPDEEGKLNVGTDAIINGLTDDLIEHLREQDVTVAANGVFYRKNSKSFYSVMIEELFQDRLRYKAKLKESLIMIEKIKEELKNLKNQELETLLLYHEEQKSVYDLRQHAMKILLNSLYGALGNNYCRWFSIANAEAVTTTGQFIIQYIARGVNEYLNKKMKFGPCDKCIEGHANIKGIICNHQPPVQRFIIYSDTDSIYISLKSVVDKYMPNGSIKEKCDFVDKICKQAIQAEINRLFRYLTTRYLNGIGEYLLMNRELIGNKGIFTAKKRYIISVIDKEGIKKNPPELKYMGVEIKKSTIPKFCRDAMEEAVHIVMEKDQAALFAYIADLKAKFDSQPIEDVSFPRSVNGIVKYGHPETIYIKGTPFHTKGVLTYNHMIDKLDLVSHYPKIRDGEKMKFFYLQEPNPFNVNCMAFATKVPPEFGVEPYINWEMQWQKSMVEPLMLILNSIGWDVKPRASIASLFEDDFDVPKIIEEMEDNTEAGYGETTEEEISPEEEMETYL